MQKNIKPTFIFWYHFLKWSGGGVPAFFFLYNVVFHKALSGSDLLLICVSLSATLLMNVLVSLIIGQYYARSRYEIQKDRIFFSNDFISKVKREVKFKNVKEVNMSQGPLQRLFGLGNIKLLTHATAYRAQEKSGLHIYDITKPEEIYKELSVLIDENENKAS